MTGEATQCAGCATELAPGLLSCPVCLRLVHADRLRELVAKGSTAENAGDWTAALAAWREAVALLPPGSRQRAVAEEKVRILSERTGAAPAGNAPSSWRKRLASLGPLGIVAALLGKAKFLFLGFTKLGTLLTFLAGLSIYWTLWGGWFALFFLLSIYVHEMGHVAALRRYGIPASAPMFVPGFGAFVRLKQNPTSPVEDARVGLAGPIWGLCAALAALAAYAFTGNPFWMAIARAGAWINLFNLIPVWQLDGSRGIRSLERAQVWMLALLSAGMWLLTKDGLLILIAILLAFRASTKREEPAREDWPGFIQFAGLIVALAMLCLIPLPAGVNV